MSVDTTRFIEIDAGTWPDTGMYCRKHPQTQIKGAVLRVNGDHVVWLGMCLLCRRVSWDGDTPEALVRSTGKRL
jgi:hypothetical protein